MRRLSAAKYVLPAPASLEAGAGGTVTGTVPSGEPIIGMEHPYHYRNKVQAAFALDRRKQIVSGVYQASTHRVVLWKVV